MRDDVDRLLHGVSNAVCLLENSKTAGWGVIVGLESSDKLLRLLKGLTDLGIRHTGLGCVFNEHFDVKCTLM